MENVELTSQVSVPTKVRKIIFKNLTGKLVQMWLLAAPYKCESFYLHEGELSDFCLCERLKNPFLNMIAPTLRFIIDCNHHFFAISYDRNTDRLQILVRDTHLDDMNMFRVNRMINPDTTIKNPTLVKEITGLKRVTSPILELKFTIPSKFSLEGYTFEAGDNILYTCTCNPSPVTPSLHFTLPRRSTRRKHTQENNTPVEKHLEEARKTLCMGYHWKEISPT